jgi:hypothetical protein
MTRDNSHLADPLFGKNVFDGLEFHKSDQIPFTPTARFFGSELLTPEVPSGGTNGNVVA